MKRKASDSTLVEDLENVDPAYSSKRPKSSDGVFLANSGLKKQLFPVLKPLPSLSRPAPNSLLALQPRAVLKPKAPSIKANTITARRSLSKIISSDLYARGTGRGGILQAKRRTATSFTRREPSTKLAHAVPFSLDAALKGTLSAYASASPIPVPASSSTLPLDESRMESSWFFSIHEDTPEQEMTNLLQHSTCVLDISSDEESEQKARHAKAEGRDKENIPPANDASQTSRSRLEATDSMLVDKTRNPLAQLNAADFYEAGCDETSIVLVSCDDLEENGSGDKLQDSNKPSVEFSITESGSLTPAEPTVKTVDASVDKLMACRGEPADAAAVLEPLEGTGQSFDVWESGSSKEDVPPTRPPFTDQ